MHLKKLIKANGKQMQVILPLTTLPDQLATSSIMKFILKFGAKTMVVYDALLSEKRILMAGSLDYSISNIIDYVFAAASLISPPFFGVQTKVYPYAQLSQIARLMQEKSYVAGVTNPMFLQNKACYDLLC